jgi:LuxR family maltose regulon positive regulatory protein
MGLNLSEAEVAVLETRTEGWIAGLQLAALSMQGSNDISGFINSFTGSHRYIIDYLTDEVLHRQPPEIQEFLLQTSILERMSASLCNAVTDREDGQVTLDRLETGNLFLVPLDNDRCWYRYHHLFADLLRQRLHQQQPKNPPILHLRASEWYEQNGLTDKAIDHALSAKEFKRTLYLIEDQLGDDLIEKYESGDQVILRRWLAELPEEFVFSKPHICILHAWNLFISGQLDTAEQSLQAVERVLEPDVDQTTETSHIEQGQLSGSDRMKIQGRIAVIRSFSASYKGDISGTIRYALQGLEYLSEQELKWRSIALITLGNAYTSQGQMAAAREARSEAFVTSKASGDTSIIMIVSLSLAEILRQQGELQQVIDICKRQFKSTDKSGLSETVVTGWLLAIWGEVLAEKNNLNEAMNHAKRGVELTEHSMDVTMIGWSQLNLVRVLFSCGDIIGAEGVIQSVENTAGECNIPHLALLQLSAWQVRIWLVQGKLDAASQWVEEHELDPEEEPTYLNEMEYIVFARILIAQERFEESDRLLQRLLESAESGGRVTRVIEILILQALAAQTSDDTDQAMSTIEQALTVAEPGGFIRIFVDEGIPMKRLLSESAARGIIPKYIDRLLAAFNDEVQRSRGENSAPCFPPSQPLVEPLTLRELEVLGLIAEGLSNPEIGDRLFIALDTVKGHNSNIYGKLGVVNRTRAIIKAKALNILPPK